jgi:hypothetical protein
MITFCLLSRITHSHALSAKHLEIRAAYQRQSIIVFLHGHVTYYRVPYGCYKFVSHRLHLHQSLFFHCHLHHHLPHTHTHLPHQPSSTKITYAAVTPLYLSPQFYELTHSFAPLKHDCQELKQTHE